MRLAQRLARRGRWGVRAPSSGRETPQFVSNFTTRSTNPDYSETAVSDNGTWPNYQWWGEGLGTNGTQDGRVIPATDLGFPSGLANVMRVSTSGFPKSNDRAPGEVKFWSANGPIAAINVGQTVYHRLYWKNSVRDAAGDIGPGGGNHYIQGWNPTGSGTHETLGWSYKWGARNDGTWGIAIVTYQAGSATTEWSASGFSKATPVRLEVAYTQTSAGVWTINARTDGADANAAFALTGTNTGIAINATAMRGFFLGNCDNGNTMPGCDADQDFFEYGAVAVKLSDVTPAAGGWIGAYSAGDGF